MRCRQAWKTHWTQGWGRGVATTGNTIFKKIITQMNRAEWCSPTSNTVQPRALTLTGVRGYRFAWAEARVCSGVRNTGHEAGGEPVGCGHRPSYPIVNSSGQCMRVSEAIGSLADLWGPGLRPPPKCFGHCCPMPHSHTTLHRFPTPQLLSWHPKDV